MLGRWLHRAPDRKHRRRSRWLHRILFFWGGTVVFGVETYSGHVGWQQRRFWNGSARKIHQIYVWKGIRKEGGNMKQCHLRIKNTTVLFSVCFLEAGDYPKKVYIVYRIETILVQECLQELPINRGYLKTPLFSEFTWTQHVTHARHNWNTTLGLF